MLLFYEKTAFMITSALSMPKAALTNLAGFGEGGLNNLGRILIRPLIKIMPNLFEHSNLFVLSKTKCSHLRYNPRQKRLFSKL